MKYLLLFFLIFIISGCSHRLTTSFSNLSKPEKTWVVFHPFKAKKAFYTTRDVESHVDSMAKAAIIGKDNNGGHLDAYKHSFWMARLTQNIGMKAASSLGEAHEKGNYKMYRSSHLEDGFLPDSISSAMDLFNNDVGIRVGVAFKHGNKNVLTTILMDSLTMGKLRILNKDSMGNFLDCDHFIIPIDSLKKWGTKKCLMPSNYYLPN